MIFVLTVHIREARRFESCRTHFLRPGLVTGVFFLHCVCLIRKVNGFLTSRLIPSLVRRATIWDHSQGDVFQLTNENRRT